MSSEPISLQMADPLTIGRYIAAATRSVQDAEVVIDKVANAKVPSRSRELSRKVLSATNQVIRVVEGIAELDPVAKAVVTVFKAIVQLEATRRDNDERILVVHHTMSLSIFALRYLADIMITEGVIEALEGPLQKMKKTTESFGNFAALYYSERRIVRFLKAADMREKLHKYAADFSAHKNEVHDVIRIQTAVTIVDIRTQIDVIGGSLFKILSTLGEDGRREKEAAKLVQMYGSVEAVLSNDTWLSEVARKLGEKMNQSIRMDLHQDLDQLLAGNEEQWKKKMGGAVIQITDAVDRSRNAILRQLNEGPHELLQDEDIKKIWKGVKWRNSVKRRVFVDAIHDHYHQKFQEHFIEKGTLHPDYWTLQILSKVMFHSAIGDAVDDDSSGFVSVYETNNFLFRRPSKWSVPEWFAFWAQGWSDANLIYCDRIQEALYEIKRSARSVKPENKEDIKKLLKLVSSFLHAIVPWSLDAEDLDFPSVRVEDEAYAEELGHLQREYAEMQEQRIQPLLDDTVIDDEASLTAIIGHSRIEISIMPLMCAWLNTLHNVVRNAEHQLIEDTEDEDPLNVLKVEMVTILYIFHSRMQELGRVWRQQRMSVTVQVESFCGGIFSTWYEKSQKSDNVLKRLMLEVDGEDDDDDVDEALSHSGIDNVQGPGPAPSTIATDYQETAPEERLKGDLDQKVQQVWKRVVSLDARLGNIESMLRALSPKADNVLCLQVDGEDDGENADKDDDENGENEGDQKREPTPNIVGTDDAPQERLTGDLDQKSLLRPSVIASSGQNTNVVSSANPPIDRDGPLGFYITAMAEDEQVKRGVFEVEPEDVEGGGANKFGRR
ncbi:uncharacterized protein STEHIDRAFT_166915 [Stereum hirsutum FP-91666 SS1]|uniref:uncharacterized protein n=1 Tax=Stereum hirsutum (strain FP-91666) TaxID=721885 RepID=UPI000440C5C2|nr:uncharacterized protein STEHIDRAFT_166915 [Stereum hirsutum FP-91666 SS1]EIM88968.1 hypothetical protein STEHIDRAFT_166915 [Stereum hirsutum FP-91666 SS1]